MIALCWRLQELPLPAEATRSLSPLPMERGQQLPGLTDISLLLWGLPAPGNIFILQPAGDEVLTLHKGFLSLKRFPVGLH